MNMDKHTKEFKDVEVVGDLILKKKYSLAKDLLRSFNQEDHQQPMFYWRRPESTLKLKKYEDENDETLLHLAAKSMDDELTSAVLHICPDLLFVKRSAWRYLGQTALHMAITTGNTRACDAMLTIASKNSAMLRNLLNIRATGKVFRNTVMMGELPLFVAALTFREEIVQLLLDHGATIFTKNNRGDTVFHSLIKYSFLNRDKLAYVVKMMAFLHDKVANMKPKSRPDDESNGEKANSKHIANFKHIWFVRNNKHETALQLASKYGLVEIIDYIINLRGVYCISSANDGLFDETSYDITEIDTIINQKTQSEYYSSGSNFTDSMSTKRSSSYSENKKTIGCLPKREPVKIESVLEMMFDKDQKSIDVVDIIEIPPIRGLINMKWNFFRTYYVCWAIFHLILIIACSAYAVNFAEIEFNADVEHTEAKIMFVDVFKYFLLLIGVFYFLIGIAVLLPRFWRPNIKRYWKHNLEHASVILIFAVSLIVEALMNIASFHHLGIPMVIAINVGWWFNIFFLRGWRMFGFFTVLLNKVIFGDFLRFAFVILFQLLSFSTIFHMLFQGEGVPLIDGDEYDPNSPPMYRTALFTLFNLMLGLGGLDALPEARNSLFAKILYVVYVLSTYILLINALIAMMSRTCSSLLEHKYSFWRITQLSVIIFLEDLFAVFLDKMDPIQQFQQIYTKPVSIYNPITNNSKTCVRYFIDMKTLQNDFFGDEIEEEQVVKEKREQSAVNNKINKRFISFMALNKSLLPFLTVVPPVSRPATPKQSPRTSSASSGEDELKERTLHPRFFEYRKGYYDSDEDDVDKESSPDNQLNKEFTRLRRGTIMLLDKDYSKP